MYYTQPGCWTSIFGKNRAYCIRRYSSFYSTLKCLISEALRYGPHVTRELPSHMQSLYATGYYAQMACLAIVSFLLYKWVFKRFMSLWIIYLARTSLLNCSITAAFYSNILVCCLKLSSNQFCQLIFAVCLMNSSRNILIARCAFKCLLSLWNWVKWFSSCLSLHHVYRDCSKCS